MVSEALLDYLLKIRTQGACLVILLFITLTFFSVKRKHTYANRLFFALLSATMTNLLLDMVCGYTLNHQVSVFYTVNRVLAVAYIISAIVILYTTYLYVKSITIELPPRKAEFLPVLLAAVSAIAFSVEFVSTPGGYILSGTGMKIAYFCGASYYFVSVLLLIHYRKGMEFKVRRGIYISLLSVLVVTMVQTFIPALVIACVGYTVICIALFYTLESPDALLIEKLAYERNRADEANRAKSAFLANMSHEIRTPINAILGMDEMILRESSERETLTYATDIQAAGKTLLSIINDILDFSKVEEGKMEILPSQYDLRSVVTDLVNMVRGRADKKGIRLEVELDETTPQLLLGDAIRIRQCALNLLTNAVKYTESGTVCLAVNYEKLDDENISLRISVTDTGIGMKQEDMDRLFSPFARIEESRNRSIEGTGLGMSITKQLIELMGSKLEVDSVYGKGSTFSFAIAQPVIKWEPVGPFSAHAEPARRSSYRELFHAPDARILVVDDTPVNLTVMRALLKKTEVIIDTADSGKEALRLASEQSYDVIFIDHMMPEMDGIETLHELKKLPGLSGAIFIALTANAVTGAREMYIEAGFSDYLSKPVDGARLEDMLVSYLPPEKLSTPAAGQEHGITKATVLIGDDDQSIRSFAIEALGSDYHVVTCATSQEVLEQTTQQKPDLIYLSVKIGGVSGFEVLQALKRGTETCDIPVVFLTDEENTDVETLGFRNGASDLIRKAFIRDVLPRRTRRIIDQTRTQSELQNEVKQQILRTERLSKEMMLALSKAVDAKDHFTKGHSERVAAYTAEIARRMGKSMQEQAKLYSIALLHDVGKIGVSEEVINKVGQMTREELDAIRRHTVIGGEILSLISEMPELAIAARSHHEWYNGSGYPDGLKGNDIPESARIICVADSYDAMTSSRAYSSVKTQSEVRSEIERCSGTQFDPQIARIMLAMIGDDKDFHMNEQYGGIDVWKNRDQLWSLADKAEKRADSSAEEEPDNAIPESLYSIAELDIPTGLRYCGAPDSLMETLRAYASTTASNADELEKYWHDGDIQNTTVKVHALKSTSKTIGATDLGGLAERLEAAGKAGDIDTLGRDIDSLIARYRALGAQLSELVLPKRNSGAELAPISLEQLHEAYDAILEFCEAFDFDSVAFTAESLRDHSIPEEERERCEALLSAVDNYDWDKLGEILKR